MPFIDLETLLRMPTVDAYSGVDIAPDGRRAAFSWNSSGSWEVYELPLPEDGAPGEARRLTSGPGAKSYPRYAPDGRLAYLLDLDGGENYDLWLYDPAAGSHTNLTPDTPDAIQPNFAWAPDGRQIAFISNRSGRFSTYLFALPLGGPEKLFFAEGGPHNDLRWSPDGRWLAVAAESSGSDSAIYLLPLDGGVEPLVLSFDGKSLNGREMCWSPDSRTLAFACDQHGVYDIVLYELESGVLTWLTGGPGEKNSPDWSPDGGSLVYVLSQGPQTWLARHELGRPDPQLFQVEPGVHYAPHFTPDGKKVLFVFDNPRHPGDVWMIDGGPQTMGNGLLTTDQRLSTIQLTSSLPEGRKAGDFIMPQHVEYPSLDGVPVPALLYLPEKDGSQESLFSGLSPEPSHLTLDTPPAVIVVHGGPNWLYQFLWYPFMTHLASRGWVVLAPNYRGSTGYGRAWMTANHMEIGRLDAMDVAAGVDYLVGRGLADPRRIAVTGRSHGGYLTMVCLAMFPERWAGGSAVVPFLNWFTAHAASRQDLQHWDIENMGSPQEHADLWRQRSPFFYLDRVQAPVQLICGAHDPRCPASESLAARDALLALGKPVDFLLYEDEGHTFLKMENVVDHELRRAKFLAQVLK